jgi:hypothetical protein
MAYATEWRHLTFDELRQRVDASVAKTGELPSTYIGAGNPQWLYICTVRRQDYVKVPYAPVAPYLVEHHRNASEIFYTLRERGAQSVAIAPPLVPSRSVAPTARLYPRKIVIDDAFIREWEPRYDRIASDEPEYRRLVTVVARDIASTGTISKGTFLAIWSWKGAMRVIRFVKIEEYDIRYAEAFRRAVSAPPQRRLYLLLEPNVKLPGVEAATGSTLLHFMDPQTMPIIDVRTVGVLFAAGLISTNQKDLEHYEEFRRAIHGIASRCPGWSLREIDRALFAYHTEVLDKVGQAARCGWS